MEFGDALLVVCTPRCFVFGIVLVGNCFKQYHNDDECIIFLLRELKKIYVVYDDFLYMFAEKTDFNNF